MTAKKFLSFVIVASVGLILSVSVMWWNTPPPIESVYGQASIPPPIDGSTPHFENTNIIINDFVDPYQIATNNTHFFVGDNSNHRIQIFRQSDGVHVGNIEYGQKRPLAIATNSTHIFVHTDRQSSNDLGLDIFRQSDGILEHRVSIGTSSSLNIATNQTHVFLSIAGDNNIVVFRQSDGEFLSPLTLDSVGDAYPRDIATNQTHIFVVNSAPSGDDAHVQIFRQSDGENVESFTVTERANGIAVTEDYVFVIGDRNKLSSYRQSDFAPAIPPFGSGTVLNGIATNSTHFFLASQAPNDQVQIFENSLSVCGEGKVIINNRCVVPRSPDTCEPYERVDENNQCVPLYCIAFPNERETIINHECVETSDPSDPIFSATRLTEIGGFSQPFGIVKNQTHIFVADTGNDQVQILRQEDRINVNNIAVASPRAITINSTHVFVADPNNQQIEIFRQSDGIKSPPIQVKGFLDGTTSGLAPIGPVCFDQRPSGCEYLEGSRGLATNSTHLFVENNHEQLQIFKQSDGAHVKNVTGTFSSLAANSTHLFSADYTNDKINIYSQSTLVDPSVIPMGHPSALYLSENYILGINRDLVWDVFTILDPSDKELLYNLQFTFSSKINDITMIPGILFATSSVRNSVLVLEYDTSCQEGQELQNGLCVPLPNIEPTANAGPDQTRVGQDSTVTLDGSGSSDSDGTITTYSWTQNSGTPVTIVNPTIVNPTFTAPAFAGTDEDTLAFTLVVTDNDGAQSSVSDTVNITIVDDDVPVPRLSDSRGGGSNGGLPPDPRVCGGVLCSEVINVPVPAKPSCGVGAHEVDGICVTEQQSAPAKSEPVCGAGTEEIDGKCVPDEQNSPEGVDRSEIIAEPQAGYIPEPTEPEYIPEPTELKYMPGTEPEMETKSNTTSIGEESAEPDIIQDFLTWFYSLVT